MSTIGRLLQIVGLVLLPAAMIFEITGQLGRNRLAELLLFMVFGFAIFYLGRYIEGFARHQ